MFSINYSATRKRFRQFADAFNDQYRKVKQSIPNGGKRQKLLDEKSKMLRAPHLQLMQIIMENYSKQLQLHQEEITWKMKFVPAFRTCRPVLASQLDCNVNTISNYLRRLSDAGFILDRNFRGSTNQFDLVLNLELFEFVDQNIPHHVVDKEELVPSVDLIAGAENDSNHITNSISTILSELKLKTCKTTQQSTRTSDRALIADQGFAEGRTQTLQHKEETKHIKEEFIIKEDEIVENQFFGLKATSFKGDTTCQETLKLKNKGSRRRISEETLVRSPLTKEFQMHFKDFPEFQKAAADSMTLMMCTIFEELTYLAPSQLNPLVSYLKHEYSGLDPSQILQKSEELEYRVMAAWVHVRRHHGQYIPKNTLKYLNPNNPNGFIRTKEWYKRSQNNIIELEKSKSYSVHVRTAWTEFREVVIETLDVKNVKNLVHGKTVAKNLGENLSEAFFKTIIKNQ